MALTVITAATNRKLASLSDVLAELPAAATADSDWLERQILKASQRVETYCDRIFAKQTYRETLPGYGDHILQLTHYPVLDDPEVEVSLRGLPVTTFSVEADVGQLYSEHGWEWTVVAGWGMTAQPIPGSEAPSFSVDYAAGYVLPDDDDDTTLPEDIQDAVVEIVKLRWFRRAQNPLERSVKIGSLAVTYSDTAAEGGAVDMPAEARSRLGRFRRLE